ncbi:hypothetical protein [Streptomyces spongiae]|uniref:Uncharacterized protein n=1 Tax=Streptomyces spongiae TaxID=565072 RepID=A0A5N8XLM7_9ACTN|nr:hypothetical protein [Streptomyces spongiae]MPY60353.1 hypothetical protein [Streptomyces spongiae]
MDRRRITRGTVGAATVVMALGALQGASAAGADGGTARGGASDPKPSKVCVGTQPKGKLPSWGPKGSRPDDTPLYRVLAYIDKTAKGYRNIFTGWAVDDAGRAADVYRVPGKQADRLDADLCGAAEKGVTVRLYDTDITQRELKALVDRIGGDMDRWKGTFMIWSVGMYSGGTVGIGVSDAGKAEPILRKAYGEEAMRHIRIEEEEQATTLPGR